MVKLPRKAPSKKVLLTEPNSIFSRLFLSFFLFFLCCYYCCLGGCSSSSSLNSRNASVLLTGFAVGCLVFHGRHHRWPPPGPAKTQNIEKNINMTLPVGKSIKNMRKRREN